MSYFNEKLDEANQHFLGADGWNDADGWEDADGDESFDGQDMLQATGHATNESQPYIVIVQNTTTADITNVEVLNSNSRQFGYTVSGLSYNYGLPNLTYGTFLSSISAGQHFNVGLVRLIYSNTSQSLAVANTSEVVTVTTNSINGNSVVKTFTPLLDDYQQIQTQVTLRYDFMVTGLVSLNIARLSGGTTVKVFLFPSAAVNQFKTIKASKTVSKYSDPNINPFKRAIGK
jgi:hypothetical protein